MYSESALCGLPLFTQDQKTESKEEVKHMDINVIKVIVEIVCVISEALVGILKNLGLVGNKG